MNNQQFPASRTVHTPTGPVHCCAAHAAKLISIVSFMGAQAASGPAPVGAQCSNCENEAKAKGGAA